MEHSLDKLVLILKKEDYLSFKGKLHLMGRKLGKVLIKNSYPTKLSLSSILTPILIKMIIQIKIIISQFVNVF